MTRARRAAVIVVLLGSASALAAANAGGERDAVSPAQTVKSGDGGLIVSVPRGALAQPTPIRIRTLPRGQFPPELRQATFKPGSKLYALEPAGLRFLKPVTITRRLDAKAQGFDLRKAVPGIVLTTRSAGGKWEILRGQTVRAEGGTLVVTATTRHFSTVVAFDGGARLSLVPPAVDAVVGARFEAGLKAAIDNRLRRDKLSLGTINWRATLPVKLVAGSESQVAGFRCTKTGTGSYTVWVRVNEDSLAAAVGSLFAGTSYFEDFTLRGRATCKASTPKQTVLSFACVVVAHSSLGSFPSYTRWLLQFVRASLPPNARAELTVGSLNDDQVVSGAIDRTTGKIELRGGIRSFGDKPVQRLTAHGQDLTQQLVAKVGTEVTVTSAEGRVAGQCPP